jgi:hypothetical protein
MIPTEVEVRRHILKELDRKDTELTVTISVYLDHATLHSKIKIHPNHTWEWYDD